MLRGLPLSKELGKLLALLLGLLHLLCLNLLLVDSGLHLGHCYWNLLLRSRMMHMSMIMRMQVTANNHDAYEWMQMNEHG
jgi:hypothetical protein